MEDNKITEIEEDLRIDKDNLDVECIDQPRRFMKWSIKFAEAMRGRDEAKRNVSITRSNLSLDIRSRPDAYGIAKATEAAVNDTLEGIDDIKEAEKEVSNAQYVVNIFSAAKEAFDQRKSMLEKIVALYLAGYYSQPKLDTEQVGKLAEEGTEAQKIHLRRKL